MKIAQIAPLYESVPPKMYGGTERVVAYLTDEFVRQGHSVTLFASGDSKTLAELDPVCPEALRLNQEVQDPLAHHIVQMQKVHSRLMEFDILHYHTDYLHFPFSLSNNRPNLTTLHGRLDIPDLQHVYKVFSDMPVVSISDAQRKHLPFANWVKTIYHGLPPDLYSKGKGEGGYAAFIGRISPEKRLDRAIEIAKRAGLKLKVAAKIDKVDADYYETNIRHLLEDDMVEFIGEIGEDRKGEFLGKAVCLLFPIDWPEPFGMVLIEALACGTPVIAFENGSVPEVLQNGVCGYIVRSVDEAIQAVNDIGKLSRDECRTYFEHHFSAGLMARNYVEVYERLIETSKSGIRVRPVPEKYDSVKLAI